LFLVSLVFGVIYYFVFVFFIKQLNIPTPGRIEEESVVLVGLGNAALQEKAAEILAAVGGKDNIKVIDACVTRIRLTVNNGEQVNEARLKELGATAVLKMPGNNFQIVVGTVADPLVTHMKAAISGKNVGA